MRRSSRILCGLLSITAVALVATASAQPIEIEPSEVQSLPTEYRLHDGLTPWQASMREEVRKKDWVEEAKRIERSRQDVVRHDDELRVRLVSGGPSSVVFRNIWGLDPGVRYSYQDFDEVGQFHIVSVGAVDNEGHFALVSAKTGLIYFARQNEVLRASRQWNGMYRRYRCLSIRRG